MSIQTYILIQTEVGKAAAVAKAVGAIPGVNIAQGVGGPYDVIMRAEAGSMEECKRYQESPARSPVQSLTNNQAIS
jgi:DNA-binding Lrp family transcriptional regulator